MKTVVLANNWLGWQAVDWLMHRGEEIVALVIHPHDRRKYGEELLRAAGLPEGRLFDGSRLRDPELLEAIRALHPEIGLSVLFDYLLEPELLEIFPRGVFNLHPSYLPYNRGRYPNVWSIVERTPAGVSLHYIDSGIDSGGIVAQREVAVEPVDTGETLYRKLERAGLDLLRETWPSIREGRAEAVPQEAARATHHRKRDVERIDRIDLDRHYTARELIDILRARTFPPYSGAYIEEGGRRIHLRLQLEYAEEP